MPVFEFLGQFTLKCMHVDNSEIAHKTLTCFKLGVQYPFKERGHRNKTHDTLWPQFQSKNEEPWESAEYAKMWYV